MWRRLAPYLVLVYERRKYLQNIAQLLYSTERLGSKLYSAWNNEVERCKGHKNRSPSLIRAGLKVFWWQITLIAIVEFIEEFFVRYEVLFSS